MVAASTETVQGIVRGSTVELKSPTHFAEGDEVEVLLRAVMRPLDAEATTSTTAAGMLADLPEVDPVLEQIYRERQACLYRESDE